MNKDVKLLTVGKPNYFFNYLKNNPNTTYYSVVWCTDEWTIETEDYGNINIPCQFNQTNNKEMIFYSIYYNYSLADSGILKPVFYPMASDPWMTYLKISIDNAIIKELSSE